MELTELEAAGLTAALYGPPADRVWLYVHGKGGYKEEAADFAALDQGREGIWNRLYDASRAAASLPELLAAAKTKRYAMARLRRMVLWSYLGLTPGDMPERVPYLRVLAANGTGCRLLSRMPVLTRPAQVRRLGPEARRLFELEVRATDLYTLAYPRLSAAGGTEWREGPVILGGPAPC